MLNRRLFKTASAEGILPNSLAIYFLTARFAPRSSLTLKAGPAR
jgi:hypothetical protein